MIITLYLVGLLLSGYLIYRYARYNPWRSTPIGRAFMASKTALFAVFAFAIVATVFPEWEGLDVFRLLLVGYSILALAYQLAIVIDFQGGLWRRRQDSSEHRKDLPERK